MTPHDIVTLYTVKALEYLIAIAFLVLFVPFWRYVIGGGRTAEALAHAPLGDLVRGWFELPASLFFHPGHAWARVEPEGVVTAGMSDFARKLVGPVEAVELPAVGTTVRQGEPAWRVGADSKKVPMLAPVTGVVVAVNDRAASDPTILNRDPYGDGWLVKLLPAGLATSLTHLRSGRTARRWMEDICDELTTTLSPALGRVYQDGGVPVDGLARAIAGDEWEPLARRLMLVTPEPAGAEPDEARRAR